MTAVETEGLAPADAWWYCGIFLAVLTAAIASYSGGMPFLLLAVAFLMAARLYFRPQEAVVAGPMFLLAANVFLPSSARFGADAPHPVEIIYWAAGSLLMTIAPFLRIGMMPLRHIPRSLKAFAVVTLLASVYGLLRGNDPSYVLRQWYGSLLLIAYFALAFVCVNEESFARALKTYSIPCVLTFVAYYAFVFQEYGVHREITTLGTQTVMLAILFAGRGKGWRFATALLVLPAFMLIVRRDLAAFVLGMTLIAALRCRTSLAKIGLGLLSATIIIMSLVPTYVAAVLDTATSTKIFDELLPQGGRDSSSIEDRAMQLAGAAIVVSRSPLLGEGMGGELEFSSIQGGDISGAYVDNGWAYLLTKMGFVGLLSFGWFVLDLLRWMPTSSSGLAAVLLTMVLLVMFAEPVFFQFTTSPFAGAIAGLLYVQSRRALSI